MHPKRHSSPTHFGFFFLLPPPRRFRPTSRHTRPPRSKKPFTPVTEGSKYQRIVEPRNGGGKAAEGEEEEEEEAAIMPPPRTQARFLFPLFRYTIYIDKRGRGARESELTNFSPASTRAVDVTNRRTGARGSIKVAGGDRIVSETHPRRPHRSLGTLDLLPYVVCTPSSHSNASQRLVPQCTSSVEPNFLRCNPPNERFQPVVHPAGLRTLHGRRRKSKNYRIARRSRKSRKS